MRERLLTKWRQASLALCALAHGPGNHGQREVMGYFRRHGEALHEAPTWPSEVRLRLTANMPYHRFRDPRSHDSGQALTAKVIGIAHALVTDGPAAVPEAELREILRALGRPVHDDVTDEHLACLAVLRSCLKDVPSFVTAPPPRTERHGDTIRHPFTFPWWRRAGSGREATMRLARGTGTVECLDADDAPVVVRLRRPDGGWLDVRRSGRTWFRPVTGLGTWEGMDLGSFVRAAVDAPAWGDNPFVPWPTGRMVPLSLGDFVPVYDDAADGHARDRARDELGALESARRIALIDGVIHRETDEPALTLIETRDGDFCPGWRLGLDRMSYDTPSTFMDWRPRTPISSPSYRRGREDMITLPPTCGAYMGDVIDAASHHARERALGDDAHPAPIRNPGRDAVRIGLYGRRFDRSARVLAEVDEWTTSGVMRALSIQARSRQDALADNRAQTARVNHHAPAPEGEIERRLGRLAVLTRRAADAMSADHPDLDEVDDVCRELATWLDGHDKRSMDLAEALIVKAARLAVDRFDMVRAAVPTHDSEDFATFIP